MGCINGKSPLTDEDMSYIARNTAMERDAVEVRRLFACSSGLCYISLHGGLSYPDPVLTGQIKWPFDNDIAYQGPFAWFGVKLTWLHRGLIVFHQPQ
jgi:hypothetical protein